MAIGTYSMSKLDHSGNEGGGACANKRRRILNPGRDSFVSIPGRREAGRTKEAIIVAVAAAATQIPD